jgi:hypothetical protein
LFSFSRGCKLPYRLARPALAAACQKKCGSGSPVARAEYEMSKGLSHLFFVAITSTLFMVLQSTYNGSEN